MTLPTRRPGLPPGLPWYRHGLVWMLIAFPAAAVIGGAVTLWLAIRSDDGLVVDDYYVRGKEINRVLDRDRAAARLGLSADLRLDPDGRRLHLVLRGGPEAAPPPALRLQLLHATRAGLDRHLVLARTPGGGYTAPLPPLAPGRWYVQIETDRWRLLGSLRLPGDTRLRIAPAPG